MKSPIRFNARGIFMIAIIIVGLCALPLFILGLFMKKGKGLMFLAGYNTMSKAQQDRIDKKELSKKAGNLLLRLSLYLALSCLMMYLELTWATFACFFLLFVDSLVSAFRMPGNREKSSLSKKAIIAVTIFVIVVLSAVGYMLYSGEKDPYVSVQDNQIKIESSYGFDINYSDVKSITLIEKSMKEIEPQAKRDNGYGGLGDILKGHFSSKNLGKFMLFVNYKASPTILIQRNSGEDIYISLSDGEKTRELYKELTKNN